MSLLQNSNAIETGGYTITKSLRFRKSATAYLNRTPASATNRKTWTISLWFKRGELSTGQTIFSAGYTTGSFDAFYMQYTSNNTLKCENVAGGAGAGQIETSAVFRDPSAWYHIVLAVDTTQATASNRAKLYVNGVQQTVTFISNFTLNADTQVNNTFTHTLGRNPPDGFGGAAWQYTDGYLAEVNFIDGQALTPSSFGATDVLTGVWTAKKYTGTYGTNGFYLPFTDTSSTTNLVKDSSGNGNNWTPNNISLTAGVTYDSMIDSPTITASGTQPVGNYAVMNPLDFITATASNANLTFNATSSVSSQFMRATMQIPTTGKWYWECVPTSGANCAIGITVSSVAMVAGGGTTYNNTIDYQAFDGNKNVNGTVTAYGASYTTNDIIGVAVDSDAGTITFYKNNASQGAISITIANGYSPNIRGWSSTVIAANFGQRPFSFSPPTGFRALCTTNLPTPTIAKGNQYMDATLFTGNGSTQTITNAGGFQPDLVWIKSRSSVQGHGLYNPLMSGFILDTSSTAAQQAVTPITFNSNGWTMPDAVYNNNSVTYVGWQWDAGSSTVTNTSGSISSQVRANTTAGVSVVTYTATGSTATVGHGLGIAPSMYITKTRSSVAGWASYHVSLGNTKGIYLEQTAAAVTSSAFWNNTSPTSSVFTIGSGIASNGTTMVTYCFAEIAGFSRFGSYTGNGSADGPFVFTGFRPKFVMIKISSGATASWVMFDSVRLGYNATETYLTANTANNEATTSGFGIDILSNGFKVRATDGTLNLNTGTYIYMAFAESPFKVALAR